MRSLDDYQTVQDLFASGINDCAISRETGIPRTTLSMWRRGKPRSRRPAGASPCGSAHELQQLPSRAHGYLLGMSRGDGCISLRYHFTNHSEDIRGLFTGALDSLGITWTRNSRYMIAIYRKAATTRLDQFVGPKSAPRPDLTAQPLIPEKCG